jgi:hypothetical protein
MQETVDFLLYLSTLLKEENELQQHFEQYISAMHTGKVDYTKEKEEDATRQLNQAIERENQILKDMAGTISDAISFFKE